MGLCRRGMLALALAVVMAGMVGLVEGKNLQDEIKSYLNKSEAATYQTIELGSTRFIVVEVDGSPKLVFDIAAELVSNASVLESVLSEYYRKAEGGAFSFRTAQDLNASFAKSYAAFVKCNKTFVSFIEENYIWRDFKCWEPGVGKACDGGTSARKATSAGMRALLPLMQALPGLLSKGETKGTFDSLAEILRLANSTYNNATVFNPFYKYFFGKYMRDDPDCGFNPEDLKAIANAISPVIETKYVGTGANATALAQEASLRKDYSRIRSLQVRGEDAVESLRLSATESKTRFAGYGFPPDAFDSRVSKAERILYDLEESKTAANAETQLNSLFSAIAEFNALKEKYALMLPDYAEMASNVRQADAVIAEIKNTNPGYAESLEVELAQLRKDISLANDALRAGKEADSIEFSKLNSRAAALKAKATGEGGAPFDWFPAIAIIIILAGAGAVYWFKVRKKGYY